MLKSHAIKVVKYMYIRETDKQRICLVTQLKTD